MRNVNFRGKNDPDTLVHKVVAILATRDSEIPPEMADMESG
jgi:hypothetical protein